MLDQPYDDRDGWIWIDGKMVPWREAKIHVLSHGLNYDSAVFEGTRLANLMADLMWLSARRREDAEKSIPLNSDFILEPRNFRLLCGGIAASLTGREVALLQFMLEAGECSKELLLARVWHYHPDSTTHTVETHLWRLRQKLQTAGISAPLIITTENGYRIA